MRLALKNTLLFLALYLLGVGAVGWWMVSQLNALAAGVAESSARLVGGEVAHALRDSALDQLQRADDTTRARLKQIVDELTEHSSILTSLAVVDHSGTVIAGDNVEIGRQLALPGIVFAGAPRVRVVRPPGPFEAGTYFVMVPLMRDQAIVGYVRLTMRSERITQLYARGLRHLLAVALAGLLAVGAGGVLLHVQLSRRSAALSRALGAAMRGEAATPGGRRDEFASALDVARQVGRELNEARGGRLQALQRMDALLKAMDVGVLMLEPDGGLGFANQRAAELLGYGDPVALARAWDTELRPAVGELLRRHVGAGGPRADGEEPQSERIAPLQLEFFALGPGADEGHVVLVRSAESLEALQSELGLAMQMRGLMRFYAAFAHDLKAPLNAMVMTLELLKLTVQQGGSDSAAGEKQIKYVGTLNEEIRRLDRQLRMLLTHTAPPSEVRGELDLRDLLRDLEALLAPQARHQRVALAMHLPDEAVTLVGWGDRIKQAMLNILVNALEAMPDGGELTMSLERRNGDARVAVHDTGPGIPPELLDTIYQMHFTTKNGGTGVGLYVARSVVEAHGGQIEVRSAAGEGTSFILILPLSV